MAKVLPFMHHSGLFPAILPSTASREYTHQETRYAGEDGSTGPFAQMKTIFYYL